MTVNTIASRLITGSCLRTLSLLLTVGVGFFLMPFLIHHLGVYEYGLWVLVGTLAGYYGFMDFGLASAVGRFTSRSYAIGDHEDINKTICSSLFIYSIAASVVTVLSLIGAVISQYFIGDNKYSSSFALALFLLGTSAAVQFPVRSFGGVLASAIRHDLLVSVDVFSLIFKTSLTVYYINRGHGILALAIINLVGGVLSYIIELSFAKRVFPQLSLKRTFIDRTRIKEMYGYSWVVFVSTLSENIRLKSIAFVIASMIGVVAVSIFSVAQRLIEYVDMLIVNSVRMLTPIFSRFENSKPLLEDTFVLTTSIVCAIIPYIFLSLVSYGDTFINLWVGNEFKEGYDLLIVIGFAMSISFINSPAKEMLYGISKHQICAITHVVQVILVLLLGIYFGYHSDSLFGIILGAAIGIILPEIVLPFVVCIVMEFSFTKTYGKILLVLLSSTLLLKIFFYAKDSIMLYFPQSYMDLFVINALQFLCVVPCIVILASCILHNHLYMLTLRKRTA